MKTIHTMSLGFMCVALFACTELLQPPIAPSRLTLTRLSSAKVVLNWQNNAPAATGMLVERADGTAKPFARVAAIQGAASTWTDTTIATSGAYRYRVSVVAAGGTTVGPEAGITITDLPTAPGETPMVVSNWDQSGWHQAWSDEFDSGAVDPANWAFDIGTGPYNDGWGNAEKEYYKAENATVGPDGSRSVLKIQAKAESYLGASYTSARLISKGLRAFKYGRIEACMKLPQGNGIWPAFWMLGSNIASVPWPACGEIDIMEMVGGNTGSLSDATTYGTIHYADTRVATANHWKYTGGNTSLSSGIFASDYHLFGVEWSATGLDWYLDGIKFHHEDIGAADPDHQKDEFTAGTFYLLLNLAVCGNWPGFSTAGTLFPQTMSVDWVRVYQAD